MSQQDRKYETSYSIYLATVAAGESPQATIEQVDAARKAVAARRDWLVGRQRRRYSHKRAETINALASQYDALHSRQLQMAASLSALGRILGLGDYRG